MFAKAVEKINKSIFPIFFQKRVGNQIRIGVAGTGFFINNKGDFVTACHVKEDAGEDAKLLYLGSLPQQRLKQPIEIVEKKRDVEKDIFVGNVGGIDSISLDLAKEKAPVGQMLCMCGYPLAQLRFSKPKVIDVTNVRIYYQPTFVLDGFKGKHNYKGSIKQWEGFMTRDTSFPGMSGGPVFDTEGLVCGMDVGTLTRNIPRDPNPISVNNGISIDSARIAKHVKEFLSRE